MSEQNAIDEDSFGRSERGYWSKLKNKENNTVQLCDVYRIMQV